MRVAVIADIHGNLAALEAVLSTVARLRVDELVVAGDVVNGAPDSLACWELVKSLKCPVLRGNHERYVYDYGSERAKPEWSTVQFAPVQFTVNQLGAECRAELASLPTVVRIPDAPDLLIVHASARNDSDLIFPYTKEAQIDPMFEGVTERHIVRGHNHFSSVHLWRRGWIVTAGSVGLPLDGTPKAQFVIMEKRHGQWRPEHHAIAYDVGATVKRFHETGYLEQAGPIAQLYLREIETAAFQIIPFLKYQTAFLEQAVGSDLMQAWEAYQKRGY